MRLCHWQTAARRVLGTRTNETSSSACFKYLSALQWESIESMDYVLYLYHLTLLKGENEAWRICVLNLVILAIESEIAKFSRRN